MKLKMVLLGVFAIFASYLVFSIPLASATNVRIFYDGREQNPAQPVQYNPWMLISRSFTVEGSSVKVSVRNTSQAVSLEKIYIYRCGGLSPSACISSEPEVSAGQLEASYAWSSVADKASGYPQTANFLVLAKVAYSGKVFWTGFWQKIRRSDASTFTPMEYPVSDIEVHLKKIDYVSVVGNFIKENRMIPLNANWVSKVVFRAASGLYLVRSGIEGLESHTFESSELSQNQVTSIDQSHTFAFASAAGEQVFSPVLLNLNPDFTCGNNACEAEKGEDLTNCCLDCPCGAGYYCDSIGSCKINSAISLSLHTTPVTTVGNCNQAHTLSISVKISNPPTGMAVNSVKFKIGSNPEQATTCSGGVTSNYVYSCPVTVPAVPGCASQTYKYGPNYINFSIRYPDGKSTSSKYMAVSFPEITIGSYSCGNGMCESSLGESQAICCYDCGCPNGYCDVQAGKPEAGSCRQDLASASLQAFGLNPPNFYTHTSGDSARFFAKINSVPATLSVSGESCSIKCYTSEGQSCTSTCSLSCSRVSSSDASVYDSSCAIGFSISGYDPGKGYTLSPTMSLTAKYTNGSFNTVQKELTASVPTISIGAHYCGDKVCNPDESPGTCCYDCPCSSGQYCDSMFTEYPTPGQDACKAIPEIMIDKIEPDPVKFTSTYEQHEINITGHLNGIPSGLSMTSKCVMNKTSGGFPCYIDCVEKGSTDSLYGFFCQIAIPSFDYNTSKFFDRANKKIVISPNHFNLTVKFNNASKQSSSEFSFGLSQVTIDVVPRCGDGFGNKGVCERSAGESGATCCYDCECKQDYGTGYFCYTGRNPNGECLSTTEINMAVERVEPEPLICNISERNGKCPIIMMPTAYVKIFNPPSDLKIESASYRLNPSDKFTKVGCNKIEPGNYSCMFDPGKVRSTTPGTEARTIYMNITISYKNNGILQILDTYGQKEFTIIRSYSEALATCLEEEKRIDRDLSELDREKRLYTILAIVFFAISLYFWYSYYSCCSSCGGTGYAYLACLAGCSLTLAWPAIVAGLIGGCSLIFVLSNLNKIDAKIKQLEAEKKALCSSSTFGDLSNSVSTTGNWLYMVGQMYGAYTCFSALMAGASSAGGTGGGGGNTGTITSSGYAESMRGSLGAQTGSYPVSSLTTPI
jgi:hypothetical protein